MLGRAIYGAAIAVVCTACGSDGAVTTGGWASGPPSSDAPVDAGLTDISGDWPKADPNPNAPPAGAPSFGDPDAGAPSTQAPRCTGKTGAAGDPMITLQSAGGARDAYVHVPASYDPTLGTMLVVNYHGFTSNAPEELILSRMNEAADAHRFIVVYPDGIASSWNAGDCCGTSWSNSVDDIQFTRDLLARLSNDYCIDPSRIYATGMSNGGFMSHRVACEMSDVFAAVAPVAGVMGIPPETCTPPRAVPVLDFHGTGDPVVPFRGGTPISPIDFGTSFPIKFRSVDDTIAAWRSIDRCDGMGKTIYAHGDASCVQYDGCTGGAEVVQCSISDGGHTWPGGVPVPFLGATSVDISATDAMVSFFLAHPMPPR